MDYVIVENNQIVGTTIFKELEGYTVLPAPKGWDGNLEKLKLENGKVVLLSEEEYLRQKIQKQKQHIKQQLISLQHQRTQEVLSSYGYLSLADVQLYASQNDEEAQSLLNWYQTYDDLIWQYIEKKLSKQTDKEPQQIEQEIFQKSTKKTPLPQE